MKAIILAAGMARRFGGYLDGRPKCLLELSGVSILERQVRLFREAGIEDIVIVKGYKAEAIRVAGARYYTNAQYEHTNMLFSLFCAQSELKGDVLISYADILCDKDSIARVLAAEVHPITVAIDVDWEHYYTARYNNALLEAESLILSPSGCIQEIGAAAPTSDKVQGQYIGLIKLTDRGARTFVSHYNRYLKTGEQEVWFRGRTLRKAFMTDFLQVLINEGIAIQSVSIHNGWLEFDSPSDYERVIDWIKTRKIENFCKLQ